jgi:hypothetical protein
MAGQVNIYLYGDATGLPDNGNQTLLGAGTPSGQDAHNNNILLSFAVAGTVPVTTGSSYWLVLKSATNYTCDYSSPAGFRVPSISRLTIND